MIRASFAPAVGMGWLTLALSLWLGATLPQELPDLPQGLRTPVLAFELLETPDDVVRLFPPREPGELARRADAFRRGTLLDFAFLVALATFLLLFARAVRAQGSALAHRVLCGALVVEACADALENVRLLAIAHDPLGELGPALATLPYAVWTKWGALGITLALLAPRLVRFGMLGRVVAALFAISAALVPAAYLLRGLVAEAMLHAATLSVVAALLLTVRERRRTA